MRSHLSPEMLSNFEPNDGKFERLASRTRHSVFDVSMVSRLMVAKYDNLYAGVPFLKDAISQHMYLRLVEKVRPRTVIDLGTAAGGSALWFMDVTRNHAACEIVTIDMQDMRHPKCRDAPGVHFVQTDVSDAHALESVLKTCPHPWIVSEDCHAPSSVVMGTFGPHMVKGDYIVFEDTHPCAPDRPFMSASDMSKYECGRWALDKLEDVEAEMLGHEDFSIDCQIQDMYGYNGATHINSVFCKTR